MSTSALRLDEIRHALTGEEPHFGALVHWFASVSSTMPLAWALVEDGSVASGTAVIADEQIAGKGRMGRTWQAQAGEGLLVSFLLRRETHPVALNRLSMAAALGIVGLCRVAGVADELIRCKWPNDVIVLDDRGAPRKVAGILIETRLAGSDWQSAVIGMGINVNQGGDDLPPAVGNALPATSLRLALGAGLPPLDRSALFVALCRLLDACFDLDEDAILERWRARLWVPAGRVVVSGGGDSIVGEMVGVDNEGTLLFRDATGVVHQIGAGDLSLRMVDAQ